jgi:hypothetical protein
MLRLSWTERTNGRALLKINETRKLFNSIEGRRCNCDWSRLEMRRRASVNDRRNRGRLRIFYSR